MFEETCWESSATCIAPPDNELPRGQFNLWLDPAPYLIQPIIMAFNGGSPALSLAGGTDETIIRKVLKTLRTAHPKF